MKKLIALLLALVMVVGMAACGAKEEAAAPAATEAAPAATEAAPEAEAPAGKKYEGVELTIGYAPIASADDTIAFWQKALAPWMEETGATVKIEINDWTALQPTYLTKFMSNDPYDLFYAWPSMLPDFIDAGFIEPLNNWYSDEQIANEYMWQWAQYTDGLTYGVPICGGTAYRGYAYNMDILAECGLTEDDIPHTWDEFLDFCAIIKEKKPDVYVFAGPLAGNTTAIDHMVFQFMAQAGGSIIDDAGNFTLNTEAHKKALQFEKTLMDNGYLSEDCLGLAVEQTRALFAEGKAAITVTYTPQNFFKDVDFEWVFTTELKDETYASFNAADIVVMSSGSKNKEAAFELMQYMLSTDVRQQMYDVLGADGCVRATDPEFPVDPHMVDAYAHPERSVTTPMAARTPGDFFDNWLNLQQQVLSGDRDIDEALAEFQTLTEAALAG